MNFFEHVAALTAEANGAPVSGLHTSRLTGATQFRGYPAQVMSAQTHNETLDRVDAIYANAQRVQIVWSDDSGCVARVSHPGT